MKAWPESWKLHDEDIVFGRDLVQIFEAFLVDLYMQGLSARAINRHKGNLWVLGGELTRRRLSHSIRRERSALEALADYVSEDGGLLLPRAPDDEQESHDSTCRKLWFFLPDLPGEPRTTNAEA